MANANKVQPGESIDDWLNRLPGEQQASLRWLRSLLLEVPGLVECVKWAHPYYEFNGVGLFSLTWSSKHVNLQLWLGAHCRTLTASLRGRERTLGTSNSETGRNDPKRRFTMPSLIPQLMLPHFRSRDVRTSRRPQDRVLPMWHSERGYAACVEIARAGINRFS